MVPFQSRLPSSTSFPFATSLALPTPYFPCHSEVHTGSKLSGNKSHHGGLKTTPEKGPRDAETRKISVHDFLENLHLEIEEFLTHPRLPVWTPPETVDTDTRQFYHDLAIPKINDKPSLLLHNLSSRANPNVGTLFQSGADHRILCNTSGAGKTALLFDGLCRHWGFYFVATQDVNKIGAKDLELAIKVMSESSGWTQDAFRNHTQKDIKIASAINEAIASKWICKVLLTRWTIFRAFVEVAKRLNAGELPQNIKYDWLIFQMLPVVLVDDQHPFVAFMNSCLIGMSAEDLRGQLSNFSPRGVLGSAFNSGDNFFYVFDEAQVAGETYMGAFADEHGQIPRPVLRPIIGVSTLSESIRFIVSGTGFSLSLFQTVLSSGVGKAHPPWTVVHKTGEFRSQDLQGLYTSKYLPPTFLSSPSGTSLVTRMFECISKTNRELEAVVSACKRSQLPQVAQLRAEVARAHMRSHNDVVS
ncbi:hypothetical protein EDB84DRAFT_1273977 [Lactarius hengduanensis]|nr:hypothetical protein EDB84DRAFT_1273977 [Lactarius hengduanensis]